MFLEVLFQVTLNSLDMTCLGFLLYLSLQSHADFQKEQLNRIDNDLMQAKKVLVDITEPRRLCLYELGLRKNFVNWVKDALEGKKSHFLFSSQKMKTKQVNINPPQI